MNINIAAKREKKRLKRMCILKGRLTAFGSKSLPKAVVYEMEAAKQKRSKV